MAVVSMTDLLEVGVHFGHQTKRWHPRMKPYIYTARNGIHIINMEQTIEAIKVAFEAVRKIVLAEKSILFVGTKKQAQQTIEEAAKKCGMFYVSHRWLGGMLTNFATVKKSINRLKRLEMMEVDGTLESMTSKEVAHSMRIKNSLERNLSGIKEMQSLPGLVFIVDPSKEHTAVKEAIRMNIPIVAIVDTNCDPTNITYPIPGNDDAIRSISFFAGIIAQAVIDADNTIGLQVIENLQETHNPNLPSQQEQDNDGHTAPEENSLHATPNLEHIPDEKPETSPSEMKADQASVPVEQKDKTNKPLQEVPAQAPEQTDSAKSVDSSSASGNISPITHESEND